MEQVVTYIQEHWFTALSVVVYLIANVVPRPSPATHKLSRGEEIFWAIVDRLCFLTSNGLPGGLKMLLSASKAPACPANDAAKSEDKVDPTLDDMPAPVPERAHDEAPEETIPETVPSAQEDSVQEEPRDPEARSEEATEVERPASEEPSVSSEDGMELEPLPQPPAEKVIEQAPVRVRQQRSRANASKKSSGKGNRK